MSVYVYSACVLSCVGGSLTIESYQLYIRLRSQKRQPGLKLGCRAISSSRTKKSPLDIQKSFINRSEGIICWMVSSDFDLILL
jgi:hypothetical protein